MSTAAKIAELITEKGWVQGRAFDDTGAICMSQAAASVTLREGAYVQSGETILAAVMELFPERTECTCGAYSMQYFMVPPVLLPGSDSWTLGSVPAFAPVPAKCEGWRKIIHFNDHEDTTLEDLMLVLKHADIKEEDNAIDRHQG